MQNIQHIGLVISFLWRIIIFTQFNSGVKYTKKNSFLSKKEKFKVIGSDAVINEVKKQKTIGIFIVGETARADRFSLNGYKKLTNPKLEKQKMMNFLRSKRM
jgi:lipid A ethanolaminephosphotransferase